MLEVSKNTLIPKRLMASKILGHHFFGFTKIPSFRFLTVTETTRFFNVNKS